MDGVCACSTVSCLWSTHKHNKLLGTGRLTAQLQRVRRQGMSRGVSDVIVGTRYSHASMQAQTLTQEGSTRKDLGRYP